MATHSSVLAWRIPGTGRPGGLPSMGSHRVGHDWSDLAAAALQKSPLFSIFLPTLVIFYDNHCLFYNSHSDRCELIPHCGFDLQCWQLISLSFFSCACWSSKCLLWENIYAGYLPLLNLVICSFFWYWVVWVVYVYWLLTPYWSYHFANIFSHSIVCFFILLLVFLLCAKAF